MTTYPDKVRRQERAEARKRRRRFTTPAIVTFRMAELFDYFNWLYGKAPLPDDDAGRDDLKLMFQVLSTTRDAARRMVDVARTWAPWFPPDELAALVADVEAHPRRFKADTIAARLGITAEIRERLNLRTIGAIDKPVEQRAAERREQQRLAKEQKRRAAGVPTNRRGPRPPRPQRTMARRRYQSLDMVSPPPASRVRHPTATVYSLYLHCSRRLSLEPPREFSSLPKKSGSGCFEGRSRAGVTSRAARPRIYPPASAWRGSEIEGHPHDHPDRCTGSAG